MSSVTTSQFIQTGSAAHVPNLIRIETPSQIEAINRQNYRSDLLAKCIAISMMSAIALSVVALIGLGLYEIVQQAAALEFQDLGRIAVGY